MAASLPSGVPKLCGVRRHCGAQGVLIQQLCGARGRRGVGKQCDVQGRCGAHGCTYHLCSSPGAQRHCGVQGPRCVHGR
eukprot:670781-Pyramimonas_sp.AAC.1